MATQVLQVLQFCHKTKRSELLTFLVARSRNTAFYRFRLVFSLWRSHLNRSLNAMWPNLENETPQHIDQGHVRRLGPKLFLNVMECSAHFPNALLNHRKNPSCLISNALHACSNTNFSPPKLTSNTRKIFEFFSRHSKTPKVSSSSKILNVSWASPW